MQAECHIPNTQHTTAHPAPGGPRCSCTCCQNVSKLQPADTHHPLPLLGPPVRQGGTMPGALKPARCWQSQCAPLAAQGISRELKDLAERRACTGDQEPPRHLRSGTRPAQPPREHGQDTKSLSARPPSNAPWAALQAQNRAWRQRVGGVGPRQPRCTPGPISHRCQA